MEGQINFKFQGIKPKKEAPKDYIFIRMMK